MRAKVHVVLGVSLMVMHLFLLEQNSWDGLLQARTVFPVDYGSMGLQIYDKD